MNGSFCTFVDSKSVRESDALLPSKKRSRKSGDHEFKASNVKNHKELDSEISLFYCRNSSCEQERGGCYKKNFITSNSVQFDLMLQVLSAHREKTRILNDKEKEEFAMKVFFKHCKNMANVVNDTANDVTALYGTMMADNNPLTTQKPSTTSDEQVEEIASFLIGV